MNIGPKIRTGIDTQHAAPPPKSPTSPPPPNTSPAGSAARPAGSAQTDAAIRGAIVISPSPAETPAPSVSITSLKQAMAFVNGQESLSTEDLFKTLLVYHKPDQGMFATPRDPQFLTAAINKGASSHGIVSDETQTRIALAIRSGQFGNPTISEEVALAIAAKLDTFTEPVAQRNIALAIYDEKFGEKIQPEVALTIVSKLAEFKEEAAQKNISRAIGKGIFGNPIPSEVANAIEAKLTFLQIPGINCGEAHRLLNLANREQTGYYTPFKPL